MGINTFNLFLPKQEKETLQTTLSMTMDDHKDLVDRLQNMTNIHITVKESLHVSKYTLTFFP